MALYRKYRPATFAEVVGQEHVTDPLSIALDTGRISHAYLFSGPRGCGKTSSARILARSLNCAEGPTSTPCGTCSSCVALGPGGPGNLDVIELDAASHGGVDDTRELRDRAFYAPAESRYRVFIVDEAHMVTTAGFNALLKIVEEPPAHLIFIFATTEPDKVLPTIRSRTHHYPFRLLPPATMRGLLGRICEQEHVPVEEAVYPLVIRAGGGSPRDSLSVLDQLLAGAGPEGVTYARAVSLLGVTDVDFIDHAVVALAADDGAVLFGTVDRVMEAGHDPRRFAVDLLDRFRDLILLRAVPDAIERGLVTGPGDVLERMCDQAARLGSATLTRYAELLHEGLGEMRGATAPRLLLEVVCARMLLPSVSDTESATLQRLERLERGLAGGSIAAAPAESSPAAPTQPPAVGGSPSEPPRRRGAEALAAIRRESRGTGSSGGASEAGGAAPVGGAGQAGGAATSKGAGGSSVGAAETGGSEGLVRAGSAASAEGPAQARGAEGVVGASPAGGGGRAGSEGPVHAGGAAPAGGPARTGGAEGAVRAGGATPAGGGGEVGSTGPMRAGGAAPTEDQARTGGAEGAVRAGGAAPAGNQARTESVEGAGRAGGVSAEAGSADSPAPVGRGGSPSSGAGGSTAVVPGGGASGGGGESAGAGQGHRPTSADRASAMDSVAPGAGVEGGADRIAPVAEPGFDAGSGSGSAGMTSGGPGAPSGTPQSGTAEASGAPDAAVTRGASAGAGRLPSESEAPQRISDDVAGSGLSPAAQAADSRASSAQVSGPAAGRDPVAADSTAVRSSAAGQGDRDRSDVSASRVPDVSASRVPDAPSSEPASGPSPAPSGDLLREVEAAWADIRAKVREFGAAVQAMLAGASVARVEGEVIVFAHQHAPLAQRLSDPRNLEAVRSAVRAVLGRDHEVRWEAGGATPRPAAAPRSGGAGNRTRGQAGNQPGRESGNAAGRAPDAAAPPRFSRPSQTRNAGADKPGNAGRSRATGANPRPYPADDDIPPPDYPDLPDDPGPADYPPPYDAEPSGNDAASSRGRGGDGVVPASTPEEEQEMMAAAADPVAPGDRRDPDEVALELLKSELGATRLDG
ncbi:DNA polymerase III subunit gamma and tau [Nocardia abscessus]|uniref:DNA polymerase III subunit gamma and tau n=1 Tax=Nocardia abscessus TaxID=120957 RepID=UPI00245888CD|nr:DNA polymerase III subunit gamma and tau [Nocardia abscessus]